MLKVRVQQAYTINELIHSHAEFVLVFQSYERPEIKSLSTTIPLFAIGSKHSKCTYHWKCLESSEKGFPSSPVIYVNEPKLYQCKVVCSGKTICSHVFDVQFSPNGIEFCLCVRCIVIF